MLCAHCLQADDEVPAVTTVNGIAVCKVHADMMLRGQPIHPVPPKKVREAVAPEPVNTNPPLVAPE